MADTTLTLGDITFADFEVPEEIRFGGSQMLSVHKLIGGARTIDAMGADEEPLAWAGRFRGADALSRAIYLNGLRKAGKPLTLTWSSLSFTVVIKEFICSFQRFYELPYSISCEVQSDNTVPITTAPAVTVDDQVSSDMSDATDLGGDIGDATLTTSLSAVSTAISAVTSFVGATSAEIASVIAPIAVAQARVTVLTAAANTVVGSTSTFGGVAAGGAGATLAATLLAQITAMNALVSLYAVADLLERMSVNLQADGASGAVLTTAGGNLYAVAASAYGDPSEWTTIAQANGLTDPVLSGINALRIPALPSGDGGVWAT